MVFYIVELDQIALVRHRVVDAKFDTTLWPPVAVKVIEEWHVDGVNSFDEIGEYSLVYLGEL